MQTVFIRRIVAAVALLTVSVAALAGAPATQPAQGLGQSWPSAQDVSQNPQWHVYVFTRDSIRYIQVSDTNGVIHAAFAVGNGHVLVLPIGTDSDYVSTPQQPKNVGSTINSTPVYRDAQLSVRMVPTTGGTGTAWTVQPTLSQAANAAAAGTGCDPIECGGDVQIQQPL